MLGKPASGIAVTGLGVLYAEEAKKRKEWGEIPDREKTGRLREVYWAEGAKKLKRTKESLIRVDLYWQMDREEIGRKRDDPGDDFIYKTEAAGAQENSLGWVEVTEVFTTTPAKKIEGAMKVLNNIENKHPVNLEEFLKELNRYIPNRAQQRAAADKVMEAVEKKIRKPSYDEMMKKYGYGTLVVGLPLWFATPPADPFRAENSLDNFVVRTSIGIEEIKQKELVKKECPFKRVLVLWEVTPEAMKEWEAKRSVEYEDVDNLTLKNPIPLTALLSHPHILEKLQESTITAESKVPSLRFSIETKVEKKKKGQEPYPDMVLEMEKLAKEFEKEERKKGIIEKLKPWFFLQFFKVLCFIKIHGIAGLERWATQRISPKWYLRRKATARRALQLYRESVRRAKHRKERKQLQCLAFDSNRNLE